MDISSKKRHQPNLLRLFCMRASVRCLRSVPIRCTARSKSIRPPRIFQDREIVAAASVISTLVGALQAHRTLQSSDFFVLPFSESEVDRLQEQIERRRGLYNRCRGNKAHRNSAGEDLFPCLQCVSWARHSAVMAPSTMLAIMNVWPNLLRNELSWAWLSVSAPAGLESVHLLAER